MYSTQLRSRLLSSVRTGSSFSSASFGGGRHFHASRSAWVELGDRVTGRDITLFNTSGEKVKADDVFKGTKVAVVGVVGAFTGICNNQIPKYIEKKKDFEQKGVKNVVCLTVNDPFVTKAWQNTLQGAENISVLADSNAEFAKALGLSVDLSEAGLGIRSTRYAMIVDEGEVVLHFQEEAPGELDYTDADTFYHAYVKSLPKEE